MRSIIVTIIAIAAGIALSRGLRSGPELPAVETGRAHQESAQSPFVRASPDGGEADPGTEATTQPIRLEKRPRKGRAFRLDSSHFDMSKAMAKAAWLESCGYVTRMIAADGKAIGPEIPTPPPAAVE